MNEVLSTLLMVFGVIATVVGIGLVIFHKMENGIKFIVSRVDRWEEKQLPAGIKVPVKLSGAIMYRGRGVYTREKFIDFSNIEKEKEIMRAELKNIQVMMK